MEKSIGLVNVGQSPRPDGLAREMLQVLGEGFEIVEAGALDGLSSAEIAALAPGHGDYVIITVLRDGSSVRLAKRHLISLLQKRIDELNSREVDIIGLTCAGEFPQFRSSRPVFLPQPILYNLVKGIALDGKVGVMTPLPEQIEQSRSAWNKVTTNLVVTHANPYGDPALLEPASAQLAKEQVDVIAMECFGYTLAMKDVVKRLTGRPVVLVRSTLARVLGELAE